jgi:uncharacterized protein
VHVNITTGGGHIIPFCNIDPRGMTNSPNAPLGDWIAHYKDKGCKGLGEIMPNLPFLDPRVQNLFHHTEQQELPLTFDISTKIGGAYGFYDDPGLPQLAESLRRFPKLNILGHGPAFWAEIGVLEPGMDRAKYQEVPILLREHPNLWGDLSAMSGYSALARDREFAARFLNEFQGRLLFATDICAYEQHLPLADFLLELKVEGKLTETAFRKIAKENAVTLFQLDA